MAEDFQASNWWKNSRSCRGSPGDGFDDGSHATSTVSCSTTITDVTVTPFAWAGSAGRPLMESTLQLSGFPISSPSTDWSQTLLSGSVRGESSFHSSMLHEDLKDMNHPFFLENSILPSSSAFPLVSSSSSMLQGLFEPDLRVEQSLFDSQQMVHYQQSQLQFTNNAPFWNASASLQPFDDLTMKNPGGGREKKSSGEPAMKKIRVETPSTLSTFKVRKEKLGDRITALQQLVSPFGKTDTASVLHEAIEYIKFLHDQVSVLSNPYWKNGHPMQQQHQNSEKSNDGEGQKKDLRSRGLCLVPISNTYPVASEATSDFWTPTFGGTYR